MNDLLQQCTVSTPGRVCMFGEHQDYLQLPVIPCAISLRMTITGRRRRDSSIHLELPDVGTGESFSLSTRLTYVRERDYFRSVVNVLLRHGFTFSSGFDCAISGNIPINAGTSSSSALVVSWVHFLARMSDQQRDLPRTECGRLAYEAEVLEFHEPGGMMDQYSTAVGGIMMIDFFPTCNITPIRAHLHSFVLGDSGEPKDTKVILTRVKSRVLNIIRQLTLRRPQFLIRDISADGVAEFSTDLNNEEYDLLKGTVCNHMITHVAKKILDTVPVDHWKLGSLLNEHQTILRDTLNISTPKINRMIDAALHAGAYGGKINGSGGGGCMFAYAPDHPEKVAEAIERVGGKAYIVTMDEGTRIESQSTAL